jgi:flagellar motor switch protein FliG
MIESEISDDVKIQENTVLQARKSIATLALKMAAEGQITLPEK